MDSYPVLKALYKGLLSFFNAFFRGSNPFVKDFFIGSPIPCSGFSIDAYPFFNSLLLRESCPSKALRVPVLFQWFLPCLNPCFKIPTFFRVSL